MSRDGMIEILLNFNGPIKRRDQTMIDFLRSHNKKYIEELKTLKYNPDDDIASELLYEDIAKKISDIENNGNKFIEVLELYGQAKLKEAVIEFYKLMDETYKNIILTHYWPLNSLFRIRPVDQVENFEKKDLFHISFNKRYLIKPYRFSIGGYPCLYLGENKEVCWLECFDDEKEDEEKKFYISEFYLVLKNKRENEMGKLQSDYLILLDLSTRPLNLFGNAILGTNKNNTINSDKNIFQLLSLYPLISACSCIVEDRNVNYKEEYVIPQLLCAWIAQTDEIDGIKYQSFSPNIKDDDSTYNNIVLPAKKTRKDGLSENLINFFKISNPVYIKSHLELSNVEIPEDTLGYIL